MLSPSGRACWRKLILGGAGKPADEREKGTSGNHIFLAQALPDVDVILPPTRASLQQGFVVLFAHSIGQVTGARALMVSRDELIRCMSLRREVCPAFADTKLDEERLRNYPDFGVPDECWLVLNTCQR
jgi:hypothetical protein